MLSLVGRASGGWRLPLYEYECSACKHRFERIQKFSDPPSNRCPKCGGPVVRLLSSPAIQFKGTGWYVTDYARKGAAAESKSEAKTDGGGEAKPPASKGSKPAGGSSTTPADKTSNG